MLEMKKSLMSGMEIVVGILIVVVGGGLLGWIFLSGNINKDSGNVNDEIDKGRDLKGIGSKSKGLGDLCSGERECTEFCSSQSFTCEAYCVMYPNTFCKERFSYLYGKVVDDSLMQFPEFRTYNYTFEDGKLIEKEPQLENIGIEIDFYNPSTKRAGDFVFDKFVYPWGEVYNTQVFRYYGEIEEVKNGSVQHSPQLVYIVPLGTKVRSIASGIVTHIGKVYSGDSTVFVVNPESPSWVYEHEHVINLQVREGDYVFAGQVIAEVSNYSQWLRNDGYGVVDIGLVKILGGGGFHYCPLLYLNGSLKQTYFEKIKALYKSWEEYMGNSSIYDENDYVVPGCVTDEKL